MLMARHKRNPPNELALNRRKAVKYEKHCASIYDIAHKVCKYLNVPMYRIKDKCRKREFVEVRHIIAYFARERTSLTLKEIGLFMDRKYVAIIHAVRTVENLIETDKEYAEKINQIEKRL